MVFQLGIKNTPFAPMLKLNLYLVRLIKSKTRLTHFGQVVKLSLYIFKGQAPLRPTELGLMPLYGISPKNPSTVELSLKKVWTKA